MAPELQFLILEDDPADFRLIERHLQRHGPAARCEHVANFDGLRVALQRGRWDAVLSDYSLPRLDFREVLEHLRRQHPDLPLILVSGSVGEEQAVELLKQGVWDFVLKDHLTRLPHAIERGRRDAADRRTQREAQAALRDSRLAALSMMEDAVDARQQAEQISAQLRQEVAERRQAEQALERSESLLAQAGQMAHLGAWEIDLLDLEHLNANPLRWSDEVYRIFGYAPGEVTPTRELFFERVHPEDRSRVAQAVHHALANGQPYEIEHRIRRPDGSERIVLEHAVVVLGVAGRHSQIVGAVQDITERKRAEAALADEAVRRRVLIEQSRDGIVVLDEQGAVYEANPRFAEMLGYRLEEMPGLHVWDWDAQWGRDEILGMIRRIGEEGDHFETRHRRKDGTCFDVEISSNGARIGGRKLVFCVCRDITERKRAEAALRESEERHRRLFESAHDAMVVLAPPDPAFISANPAAGQMFGAASADALCGRSPADLSPPCQPDGRSSADAAAAMIAIGLERGVHAFEWVHRRLSGEEFPALVTLTRVQLHGQLLVQATVRDVTERKQVERELHRRLELQHQLAQIAATVPGAIFSFRLRPDGSTAMPYASASMEAIFQLAPESVRDNAQAVFERIHPEDLAGLQRSILDSARDLTPWRREFRVRAGRRGELWVEAHSVPQREPDGSVLWQGFMHDVTERKRTELQLRQLSRAVEQSPAAVVITDPRGCIEYTNPRFTELTGYTAEEAKGRNPRILKSGETPVEIYRELWHTIQRGDEWRGEFHNRRKDGRLFWEAAAISPIVDDTGRITHFLGVKEDITERKRLERERTAMEAQLRQQQKLESMGTLAGGVAHEINNPINGIMNYAQIIQDRLPAGSPLVEFTGEILHETQRVATIVRNLLTFSRNEKQSHSPARLADIVESTLTLIRTVIRHDRITLEVAVPEDLPTLRCRSQQIRQVLMNLVTNARDALNERFPGEDPDKILRIAARAIERAGGPGLRLTVEDHGTGIAPEIRERMFDPFFTTKPRDLGTGLGLSISHGIVKEHGGEIVVESEPGRFTRLHVDLPLSI